MKGSHISSQTKTGQKWKVLSLLFVILAILGCIALYLDYTEARRVGQMVNLTEQLILKAKEFQESVPLARSSPNAVAKAASEVSALGNELCMEGLDLYTDNFRAHPKYLAVTAGTLYKNWAHLQREASRLDSLVKSWPRATSRYRQLLNSLRELHDTLTCLQAAVQSLEDPKLLSPTTNFFINYELHGLTKVYDAEGDTNETCGDPEKAPPLFSKQIWSTYVCREGPSEGCFHKYCPGAANILCCPSIVLEKK